MSETQLDAQNIIIVNVENPTKVKRSCRRIPAIGIILALGSAVFFSTGSLVVKLVPELHPVELLVVRSGAAMIIYFFVMIIYHQPFSGIPGERIALVLRAIFGFVSISCGFYSFRLLPLADASTLIFSSPVYVSIFAWLFLKEGFTIFQCLSLVLTLVGVVLIARPTFIFGQTEATGEGILEGTLLGISCSLFSAASFIAIRKCQRTPAPVVIFWFSTFAVVVGTIFVALVGELTLPNTLTNYLLLGLLAFCGTCGQLMLTLAFKYEQAGPVSVCRSFDIVVAFIYQITLLHERTFWTSVLGAIIVVSCVAVMGFKKWLDEKLKTNKLNCCKKRKDGVSTGEPPVTCDTVSTVSERTG